MSKYTVAVQELAISRGDTNQYRLAKRLGIPDSRASQLWNGHRLTKIGLDTIARICDAYGCTPNDFITPVPEATAPARPKPRKQATKAGLPRDHSPSPTKPR
jgi:DNA-binding Xre family transcriptional regulator